MVVDFYLLLSTTYNILDCHYPVPVSSPDNHPWIYPPWHLGYQQAYTVTTNHYSQWYLPPENIMLIMMDNLPLPHLPPPTRPRGPQLGTPAVTLTIHPYIHPWSWSWCHEWNIINNIGNIFPTNNCRFMTRPRRNKKNVADESLKWLCFHSRPQTWHRIFKTNVIY